LVAKKARRHRKEVIVEGRRVKPIRNVRNRAIRHHVELDQPGEAVLGEERDRPVLEPTRMCGLLRLLATMEPLAEEFP
jgi:hypothetical protein